jgi:hypothetical protein
MARRGLWALAALLVAGAGAGHAAPVPDYVLTQTWRAGPDSMRTQTIRHHAGWFRIDQPDGSYFEAPRQGFQIGVTHYGQVETNLVSFRRGDPLITAPIRHRQATGEQNMLADEPCARWRVSERHGASRIQTRQGCTTPDGIDLWNAAPGAEPPLTVHLERRAVSEIEVTPPLALFDLRAWSLPSLPTSLQDSSGDFEILLARTSQLKDFRSPRRRAFFKSGVWGGSRIQSEGRTFGNAAASSPAGVLSIAYEVRAGHLQTMSISRHPARAQGSADSPPTWPKLPPDERVLGESCAWRAPAPVAEEDTRECRTADGAILKIWTSSWGHEQTWRAVRLKRAAVPVSRLLPPTAPRIAAAWKVR